MRIYTQITSKLVNSFRKFKKKNCGSQNMKGKMKKRGNNKLKTTGC